MIFFIIGVVAALVALAVRLLSEEGKAAAFIPGGKCGSAPCSKVADMPELR